MYHVLQGQATYCCPHHTEWWLSALGQGGEALGKCAAVRQLHADWLCPQEGEIHWEGQLPPQGVSFCWPCNLCETVNSVCNKLLWKGYMMTWIFHVKCNTSYDDYLGYVRSIHNLLRRSEQCFCKIFSSPTKIQKAVKNYNFKYYTLTIFIEMINKEC